MTKGKSVGPSIMMKIGKEVAQSYTVSRYGNPIPQKEKNSGRARDEAYTKMVSTRLQQRESWEGNPPEVMIMDNLETLLATTVDKDHINTSGAVVKRFIKSRASTMFGNPSYFLDVPGSYITVQVPHEDFSTVL